MKSGALTMATVLSLAACSSSSIGGPLTGPSASPDASTSYAGGADAGLTPQACSTDGSDAIVVGSYAYGCVDVIGNEVAFSIDIFLPNCRMCSDGYHVRYDPTEPTLDAVTWSSAWNADHSMIVVRTSNGLSAGMIYPDGHALVLTDTGDKDAGVAPLQSARLKELDPDMLRCDGYLVVSASNYYR